MGAASVVMKITEEPEAPRVCFFFPPPHKNVSGLLVLQTKREVGHNFVLSLRELWQTKGKNRKVTVSCLSTGVDQTKCCLSMWFDCFAAAQACEAQSLHECYQVRLNF